MASTAITTTIWTCDRCGVQEEAGGSHSLPAGWNKVGFAEQFRPISGYKTEEREPPTEICRECVSAFKDWLKVHDA